MEVVTRAFALSFISIGDGLLTKVETYLLIPPEECLGVPPLDTTKKIGQKAPKRT